MAPLSELNLKAVPGSLDAWAWNKTFFPLHSLGYSCCSIKLLKTVKTNTLGNIVNMQHNRQHELGFHHLDHLDLQNCKNQNHCDTEKLSWIQDQPITITLFQELTAILISCLLLKEILKLLLLTFCRVALIKQRGKRSVKLLQPQWRYSKL